MRHPATIEIELPHLPNLTAAIPHKLNGRAHVVRGEGYVRIDLQVEDVATGAPDPLPVLDVDISNLGVDRRLGSRENIWLPTGQHDLEGRPLPDLHEPVYDADNTIALFSPNRPALVAGGRFPGRYGLRFRTEGSRLRVLVQLEGGRPPGGVLNVDPLFLVSGVDLTDALQRYGDLNRITPRAGPDRTRLVVWNTWDWFADHIDQDEVVRMAQVAISTAPLAGIVNVICLDMGWALNGDEDTPYERFADLQRMAAGVSATGCVPGIWYAPFLAHRDCRWLQEHPDTELRGEPRGLWPTPEGSNPQRVLDPTHPLVQRKIYGDLRFLRECGFRYYKTDYLQQVNARYRNPRFHDAGLAGPQGVRACAHIIRAAIGADSWWLACGTEIQAAAGLADSARTGDDIRLYYSTLTVAVRHAAAHAWANGKLFYNDPDFLIVRCREHHRPDTPYLHRESELMDEEKHRETPYQRAVLATGPVWDATDAETWANFHIVYGGSLTLGDHPEKLNQPARDLTARVLRWATRGDEPGIPLDLDERNVPQRWLRPLEDGWLLGLFNFADVEATVVCDAGDLRRIGRVTSATDIATGQPQEWSTLSSGGIVLPAHASRVFRLRR